METKQTYRPYPGALLNPRYDFVFKALFTENSDASRRALKSFLTAMCGKEIVRLELKPNEPARDELDGKDMRFDVACTFCDGESADIEAQGRNSGSAFNDREAYLVSRLMVHNLKQGKSYLDLKKVYQIGVVNFILNPYSPDVMTHYEMRSAAGHRLSDKLNIVTLELPKIKKLEEMEINSLQLHEKWGIFFKEADNPKRQDFVREVIRSEEGLMEAQEVLDRISLDEIEWKRQFDADVLAFDRATEKAYPEHMRQIGYKEGLEEGRAEAQAEMQARIAELEAELAKYKNAAIS